MTKNLTPLRLAPLALAAALAFPTTGALAQETVTAEPAPVAAPPPVQTPTIVVPTFPEPTTAPSASAAPVSAAPRATAPAARAAPARTAVPTARVPARTSPAPEVAAVGAAPIAAAPAEQTLPAAEPIAPATVTAATPVRNDSGSGMALAGLAGILALGGVGLLSTRRRDGRVVGERRAVAEPIAAALPPLAVAPRIAAPLPLAIPAVASVAGAGALAAGTLPDTPERRRDLIEAMVAAQPDEANPFRTRKARRHRARIILQGMAARHADRAPAQRDSYDWNKLHPTATPQRELQDA